MHLNVIIFRQLISSFSSVAGAHSIGDCLSVCVDVVKLFSNCCISYSFCLILTKLGTHDLCANMQKSLEDIFEVLILKFLAKF